MTLSFILAALLSVIVRYFARRAPSNCFKVFLSFMKLADNEGVTSLSEAFKLFRFCILILLKVSVVGLLCASN